MFQLLCELDNCRIVTALVKSHSVDLPAMTRLPQWCASCLVVWLLNFWAFAEPFGRRVARRLVERRATPQAIGADGGNANSLLRRLHGWDEGDLGEAVQNMTIDQALDLFRAMSILSTNVNLTHSIFTSHARAAGEQPLHLLDHLLVQLRQSVEPEIARMDAGKVADLTLDMAVLASNGASLGGLPVDAVRSRLSSAVPCMSATQLAAVITAMEIHSRTGQGVDGDVLLLLASNMTKKKVLEGFVCQSTLQDDHSNSKPCQEQ